MVTMQKRRASLGSHRTSEPGQLESQHAAAWSKSSTAQSFPAPSRLNPQPRECPTNSQDLTVHNRTLLTPPLYAAGHILHKLLSDQATLKCTASNKRLDSSNGLAASRAVATLQSFISDSLGLKTWGNPLSLSNIFPAQEPDSQFCSTTWTKTVESFALTSENTIYKTYSSGLSDGQ